MCYCVDLRICEYVGILTWVYVHMLILWYVDVFRCQDADMLICLYFDKSICWFVNMLIFKLDFQQLHFVD